MDCSKLKRFLSFRCCSCSGDESTSGVQVTRISSINEDGAGNGVGVGITANDRGTETKQPSVGIDNCGFKEDEIFYKVDESKQGTAIQSQPKPLENHHFDRQTSEISNILQVDEKGLTELVLEEIGKFLPQDVVDSKSLEEEIAAPDPAKSEVDNGVPNSLATPTRPDKVNTETEWRDKLMRDLNEDSDEFDDYSSSDDAEVNSTIDHTSKAFSKDALNHTKAKMCQGRPVVIDLGEYETKIGFSGDFRPSHNFRTVVGGWENERSDAWREIYGDKFVGLEAIRKHSKNTLVQPYKDGDVADWKAVDYILEYALSELLDVDTKNHPFLFTEPSSIAKKQREKMLEVVMEYLMCPLAQFRKQTVLSSIAAGIDVGIVVNSGYSRTEIAPVYHGYEIASGVETLKVGGRQISEYLSRLLQEERGLVFSSTGELEVLEDIKRSHAKLIDERMPRQPQGELVWYEFPDGNTVGLGGAVTECTELLYKPKLAGIEEQFGIAELITHAVERVDRELRCEMRSSVLLSGGCSELNGFEERLDKELNGRDGAKYFKGRTRQLNCSENKWRLKTVEEPSNSAWTGGSVYADSDSFRDECISADTYYEIGSSVIHMLSF